MNCKEKSQRLRGKKLLRRFTINWGRPQPLKTQKNDIAKDSRAGLTWLRQGPRKGVISPRFQINDGHCFDWTCHRHILFSTVFDYFLPALPVTESAWSFFLLGVSFCVQLGLCPSTLQDDYIKGLQVIKSREQLANREGTFIFSQGFVDCLVAGSSIIRPM